MVLPIKHKQNHVRVYYQEQRALSMPNRDYQEERREYEFAKLSREDIHLDPFLQFSEWMDAAYSAKVKDPTAMSISTVGEDGQPHSRIVLLKEFDQTGLVFYTHYESAKGQEIAYNPKAAALFFWPEMDRQIRIEGSLVKTSRETSESYFKSRPIDSQLAATASQQSQKVPGRRTLELNYLIAQADYEKNNQAIECPKHWGGYCLLPNHFEFWQGRAGRLHDRFIFEKEKTTSENWQISRLAP